MLNTLSKIIGKRGICSGGFDPTLQKRGGGFIPGGFVPGGGGI